MASEDGELFKQMREEKRQRLHDKQNWSKELLDQWCLENEVECETKGIVSYSSTSFTLSKIDSKFIEEYTGYAKGEGEFPIADFSPIDNLYGLHEESFEILGNIHLDDELLVSHTNT